MQWIIIRHMKRFIAIVLFLAGCVGGTQILAHASGSDDPPQEIVIRNMPPNAGQVPRTPVEIPISAMVNGNTVYVTFTGDLGDVDYELVNLSTAETVSDQVEGTGLVLIPFSGDAGTYTLTFTLESGMQYYGEFSL